MRAQRDLFISELTKQAANDTAIVFLSADFGAPALDKFVATLPEQFFHLGISEQNMIDVAIGLALQGKKVFTYAMAPFIVMRCAEQHKLSALMELPITTIVTGVGLGYANAGPTHYATEDLGVAMGLIGSSIYTISDPSMAAACATYLVDNPKHSFVRLDRMANGDLDGRQPVDFQKGYRTFFDGRNLAVISHGYMLSKIVSLAHANPLLKDRLTIIDLFCSKPIAPDFIASLNAYDGVLVVDEQVEQSSLGLFILPQMLKFGFDKKVKTLSLSEKFMFGNSGRDALIAEAGLSDETILNSMLEMSE